MKYLVLPGFRTRDQHMSIMEYSFIQVHYRNIIEAWSGHTVRKLRDNDDVLKDVLFYEIY